MFADETQMHFKDLSDIHTRRNAEGVQYDLQGSAVRKERHIRLWKHARNNALVTVASRHLVADLYLTLLRDIYAHELADSGGQLVLVLAGEDLDVYDDTAFAVGNFEGRIPYFPRLLREAGSLRG